MQRTLWLIVPLVMSGCIWAREHERERDYESSWEYESSLELEGRHAARRSAAAGNGSEACVVETDRDASVSDGEAENAKAAPVARCTSNRDCEDERYCDEDSGKCLQAVACEDESSCDEGFNCDPQRSVCLPADAERCSELASEAQCAERNDCIVTYAGINCSCGADCTCTGGEPGCVCDSFEFHACTEVTKQ